MADRKIRVERIRVTRTGVWFIVVCLIVGAAAANTGNNALYLVAAMLLALLAVSGLVSRRNLRQLEIRFSTPPEVHAGQTLGIPVTVSNLDSWLARRFVLFSGIEAAEPLLVSRLERGAVHQDRLFFRFERRGLYKVPYLRVSSLFPLGLVDKAMQYPVDLEVLVYPRVHPVAASRYFDRGRVGDELTKKAGWSHELRSLRPFRQGDDPRSIHWKRSARTGDLIYMEREAEAGRRLAIYFDNAFGDVTEGRDEAFEGMVSEVASLATQYIDQGFEVALTTRDEHIHYGRGRSHAVRLLRVLAVIESVSEHRFPLWKGRAKATEVRLGPARSRVAV